MATTLDLQNPPDQAKIQQINDAIKARPEYKMMVGLAQQEAAIIQQNVKQEVTPGSPAV